MDFSTNLYSLRTKLGITQEELANRLGVTSQAVSLWEVGRTRPRLAKLNELAQLLGTTVVELLGDGVSALEGSSAQLPLVTTAHMGSFEAEDSFEGKVEVPLSVAEAHPHAVAVHGFGSCMNRKLPEDALLVIDPDLQPRNGQAVFAETADHQAIIRTFFMGSDTLILSAESWSDSYEDIVVRPSDPPVSIRGVVVWYQAMEDIR